MMTALNRSIGATKKELDVPHKFATYLFLDPDPSDLPPTGYVGQRSTSLHQRMGGGYLNGKGYPGHLGERFKPGNRGRFSDKDAWLHKLDEAGRLPVDIELYAPIGPCITAWAPEEFKTLRPAVLVRIGEMLFQHVLTQMGYRLMSSDDYAGKGGKKLEDYSDMTPRDAEYFRNSVSPQVKEWLSGIFVSRAIAREYSALREASRKQLGFQATIEKIFAQSAMHEALRIDDQRSLPKHPSLCRLDGCEEPVHIKQRGLCKKHCKESKENPFKGWGAE
jgi:hypothetical protein